ncbi:pyridoxamine 5'-phosphate oxidase family protein [Nonomuraea guangzhouensis]|uniref:Pyridoxamine 5'-phosphate oxidase family protein n=1 Tax=Nonomuraea guangzhouensis TaxID=1291555 RepID=A0ABW4GHA1_9ACTN|nr:pyridoxamine 5'-phosphate oxidase family protein [Nonomuraea guangzhouensis]
MTTHTSGPATDRVRVRRRAERASYDQDLVREILDEALLCRVAFVDDGRPYVLPTLHTRQGDTLYFHGSQQNRMLDRMLGEPICVEATVVDSLVLGRSVFQNSMNYRSVVVLGTGHEIVDRDAKLAAMLALVDRLMPGRGPELRPLTEAELGSTRIIAVPLDECSAKVRTGPPVDREADYDLPVWAGELPLRIVPGTPVPEPHLTPGIEPRDNLVSWGSGRSGV